MRGRGRGIQCVVFDLDDTLWSTAATLQHAHEAETCFFFAKRLSQNLSLEDLQSLSSFTRLK